MGFLDELGRLFLPKPYKPDDYGLDFDIEVPLAISGTNRNIGDDNVALWNFHFDPKVAQHSLRADMFREFYDPALEIPLSLLYNVVDKEFHGVVGGTAGFMFFLAGTQGLAVVEHENGHYSAVLETGAKANLEYHIFDAGPHEPLAAVSISMEEFERIPIDDRLLIGGAGLSAVLESSRSTLENAILDGYRIGIADSGFLISNFIGHFIGYKADYAQNQMLLHPDAGPTGGNLGILTMLNANRPIALALPVYSLVIGPEATLPPIIPDWSATFGPLGNQYTGRVYARLNDRHVVEPYFRVSDERLSGSAGLGWFLTENDDNLRGKIYAEGGYQPHFGGLIAAAGLQAVIPLFEGFALDADLNAKTYGFFPDWTILAPAITGILSVNISDEIL